MVVLSAGGHFYPIYGITTSSLTLLKALKKLIITFNIIKEGSLPGHDCPWAFSL